MDGLVAYYPFSGNANDASGNAHHGTNFGADPTLDRFGNSNSAYYFDGSNPDRIEITNVDSLSPANLTIAVWIYQEPSNHDSAHILSNQSYPPYKGYGLYTRNADPYKLGFQLLKDSSNYKKVEDDLVYPDEYNKWMFVAATYDGSNMVLYKDAILQGTWSYTEGYTKSTETNMTIGNLSYYYHQPLHYFKGSIDDVYIFNRALSEDEIYQLNVIPEPTTMILLGSGLIGFVGIRRKIKNRRQ